jgi:hypothetical protein
MAKRSRELARQQKKEEKQERQEARGDVSPKLTADEETNLHEEFARLSHEYAADKVSQSHFDEERHRIFVALGIETDDDD